VFSLGVHRQLELPARGSGGRVIEKADGFGSKYLSKFDNA